MGYCREWLKGYTAHQIVTVNPEMLLRARRDGRCQQVIESADLVIADGIGVRWAGAFLEAADARGNAPLKVLGSFIHTLGAFSLKPQTIPSPIPERIPGSDLLWDIAREAAAAQLGVYLVGGAHGTAVRAAAKLREVFPSLRAQAFAPDHPATAPPEELTMDIERAKPAVIFVAYGVPQQEVWIHLNLHRFPSLRIAMGIGGALDFLAGNVPRAPVWYQVHGWEWFWRLTHQPSRLVRIVRATMLFPVLLLCTRLRTQAHDT